MFRRLLVPRLLIPFGIVAFIVGAKFALIHFYASDQPFNDQWNAEGGGVFRWRLGGAWDFSHHFFPQGEHTPALTRIALTGVAALNAEQWDSRLPMMLSVAALALAGVLFWQIATAVLPSRWQIPAAIAAALLLAMPCNYENYLWGFQTQFVFLILFSLAHVWGSLRDDGLGASWWLAQACGFVALFSIASGVMSSAVLLGLAGLRLVSEPRSRWAWATLAVNALWIAGGILLLRHGSFAADRTTGVSATLFSALGHLLSWPLPGPWWWFAAQAPGLAFVYLTRRRWQESAVRLLLALQLWCWALAAAFAYGRGTGPGEIAVRYQDHLTLGLVANVFALAFVLGEKPERRRAVVGAAWAALLVGGLLYANRPYQLRENLAWQRDFYERQRIVLTDYLSTNDTAILERDADVRRFLTHFEATKDVLADGMVRFALPGSIAQTLAVSADRLASSPGAAFRVDRSEWQSNGARVLRLHGGNAGAQFVSLPLTDDFRPVWRVRVSGRVGPGAADVLLRTAAGEEIRPLDGAFDATGRWKAVNFLRGRGPVRLEVRVPAGVEIRVSEPVELGWLSWLAPKVAGAWGIFLSAGVACFGVGLLRRHSAPA